MEKASRKKDGFLGERMVVLPTQVFTEYARHPLVRRLYLTDVGFFPRAKHHYRERKEGIEEFIFIYCTDGQGVLEIAGREYRLLKNEAICIPRLTPHRYNACAEDPWSILWVHFRGGDVALFPLEDCRIVSLSSQNAVTRMTFLFELLLRAVDANYTQGNFIYMSQVLALILSEAYYREKKNSTREQNKHVTSVVRFMYQHLDQALTLDQISGAFSLSKSYLNLIFKQHTQHAPMDFFIQLKMQKACSLLRSTEWKIYQIGQAVGYQDPYYFSRIFAKTVGLSPKGYRQSETATKKNDR